MTLIRVNLAKLGGEVGRAKKRLQSALAAVFR
jgi:hypothetical protein